MLRSNHGVTLLKLQEIKQLRISVGIPLFGGEFCPNVVLNQLKQFAVYPTLPFVREI